MEAKTFKIARYVELVADGDPLKLMNTGFTMHSQEHKTPASKSGSMEVTGLHAKHGPSPGQVFVGWKRLALQGPYELQMMQMKNGDVIDEGNWKPAGSYVHCSNIEFANLESVTRVAFRVRFVAKKGAGPWTAPITIVVL